MSSGNDPDKSTRKQRREQAREQRKAMEAAEAAAAARRRRLSQLGAVAAVVLVAIVVIIVATSGKSGNQTEPHTPKTKHEKNEALEAVESEIGGVEQSGNLLGKANAPVTMQYFGDLECPICRDFTLGALPGIIQNEVRKGKLKIEYLSLSTATGNAESSGAEPEGTFVSQQVAALAAGKQSLAWYYIELFYHEQGKEGSGYVNESYLQGIAQQVPGLNLKQWSADRNDQALKNQIYAEEKAANEIGYTATPSFMIGKTGTKLKPFQPSSLTQSSAFEGEIDKLAS